MCNTLKVLIINPGFTYQCGVFQHGLRFYKQLASVENTGIEVVYKEITTEKEYIKLLNKDFDLFIVNYYNQSNMPYVNPKYHAGKKVLAIGHEFESLKDLLSNPFDLFALFDESLSPKSTVEGKEFYRFRRPLPAYTNNITTLNPDFFYIGTFGYYFPNKGFEKVLATALELRRHLSGIGNKYLADMLQVRMHITKPTYSGYSEEYFRNRIQNLFNIAKSFNLRLFINTEGLSDNQLITTLSHNHVNLFLYDINQGRGISSAIDFAFAANRPIITSYSTQFRNLKEINRSSLGKIEYTQSSTETEFISSEIGEFYDLRVPKIPSYLNLLPNPYTDFYRCAAEYNLETIKRVINES